MKCNYEDKNSIIHKCNYFYSLIPLDGGILEFRKLAFRDLVQVTVLRALCLFHYSVLTT